MGKVTLFCGRLNARELCIKGCSLLRGHHVKDDGVGLVVLASFLLDNTVSVNYSGTICL